MRQALEDLIEAVETAINAGDWKVDGACDPTLALIRAKEALAQPEQEPVAFEAFNAWMHYNLPVGTVIGHSGWWADKIYSRFIKNATPPQRKPLKFEEMDAVIDGCPKYHGRFSTKDPNGKLNYYELIRAIEAAHNIKE